MNLVIPVIDQVTAEAVAIGSRVAPVISQESMAWGGALLEKKDKRGQFSE